MSKVSLIITTFNRPQLLARAVASALQAGGDLEVIVVDDASTDGTASVCQSLDGIKYLRLNRNQGVAGARNVGLLESTGDFIAFLDDDDLRLPGSIDLQRSLLTADPEAGLVASAAVLADHDGILTGEVSAPRAQSGDVFWQALELNLFLLPGTVLVRKSCFLELGLFNKRIAGIDDWDMWVRIAELWPVVIDDHPVCIYRCAGPGSGQGSSALGKHLFAAVGHQRQLLALPRAQAAPASLRRAVRRGLKRRIADTLSWRAAEQLPHGSVRYAAMNVYTALRINPWWAVRPTHFRVMWRSMADQLRRERGEPDATSIG